MAESVFERLQTFLKAQNASFNVQHHAPVFTSEEAASVRGTSLASGAKALICRADDRFVMFVLPADRRLASKETRRNLGIRSLRFATAAEVEELTGLKPGSIPPLGSLFSIQTYCDRRLAENERINFNAGDHGISISLAYSEYARVEPLELGEFAE
jgi:Ala-tRNA(Pro) deacylase